MEELYELRAALEAGHYEEALALLDEMEAMSRDDKIDRIASFMEVLLLHLIKQAAEARTARSWDISMAYAIDRVVRTNKRRKAGGYYLPDEDLQEALDESYPSALKRAAHEAFEGLYSPEQLGAMVDRETLLAMALEQILLAHHTEQER